MRWTEESPTGYMHAAWTRSYTRALARQYASREPCHSRWSSAMFRHIEASGDMVRVVRSWKEDSSTAKAPAAPPSVRDTSATAGLPTFPTALPFRPPASRMASAMDTAVVLPLVPVTHSHGAARPPSKALRRQASSISLHTGTPARDACSKRGPTSGTAGAGMTTSGFHARAFSARAAGSAAAPRSSTSPAFSRALSFASHAETTASVASASAWTQAAPDLPRPTTATLAPASSAAPGISALTGAPAIRRRTCRPP